MLPVASGAVTFLYVKKQMSVKRRVNYEQKFKDLIKSLDDFECNLKKVTKFMGYAQVLDLHAKILERYNKDNKVISSLFDTLKRIVRSLSGFVKYLEYFYKLNRKLDRLYIEMDDIDNCPLMQRQYDSWDSHAIKVSSQK
jgi:hypothetical protein